MTRHRYGTRDCFCCGRENRRGLAVAVEASEEEGASFTYTIDVAFQSFPGMAHGGISTTLIDEALWYAFYARGIVTVTRKLDITFKHHVPIAEPVRVSARVTGKLRGPLWAGEGSISDMSGKVLVRARGEFAQVKIRGHTDYDLIAEPDPARQHKESRR